MNILIFLTDRYANRNLQSSNLIDHLKEKGHKVDYFDIKPPQSFLEKLVTRFRKHLYKILYFRYAEISGWKKQQFKREHPENNEYDASLGRPFKNSKLIYSFLNAIFLRLPSFIKLPEQVDCILVTSCQDPITQLAVHSAAKHRIPVICLVNSWDHLTHGNKAISASHVKFYLAWNEIQKKELHDLHSIPLDKIKIIGALQFDFFINTDIQKETEQLREKLKIPLGTKVIFLPAYNERHGKHEPMVVQKLLQNKHRIKYPFKLIVRPYPNKEDFFARYAKFENDNDCIFSFPEQDLIKDRKLMMALIKNSDLVLSGVGTVAIEAMYYNKPVIHLGIEPSESKSMNFLFKKFYFSDHYEHIMKHEASVFAQTFDEFFDAVNGFLDDPKSREEKAQAVVKEQLHYLDGKSHERIEKLISSLK